MDNKPIRGFAGFEMFPLLVIPVAIYNFIALVSPNAPSGSVESGTVAAIRAEAFALPMLSQTSLSLSWGDLLVLLAIVLLLVEVVKSARTTSAAIANHMLSFGVFIMCLIEFLLLPGFASAAFFLITMIVLLDALAGMAVTIVSARRDLDVGGLSS